MRFCDSHHRVHVSCVGKVGAVDTHYPNESEYAVMNTNLRKNLLKAAVAVAVAAPLFASAESNFTTGAGTPITATARLDFQIVIPKILFLQVGTGTLNAANAAINQIAFTVPGANVGDSSVISASAGSGDLGNGVVTAKVTGNNGTIAFSSTTLGRTEQRRHGHHLVRADRHRDRDACLGHDPRRPRARRRCHDLDQPGARLRQGHPARCEVDLHVPEPERGSPGTYGGTKCEQQPRHLYCLDAVSVDVAHHGFQQMEVPARRRHLFFRGLLNDA